jgi:hypothetical protein
MWLEQCRTSAASSLHVALWRWQTCEPQVAQGNTSSLASTAPGSSVHVSRCCSQTIRPLASERRRCREQWTRLSTAQAVWCIRQTFRSQLAQRTTSSTPTGSLFPPSHTVAHPVQSQRAPLGAPSAVRTPCFMQIAALHRAQEIAQTGQTWWRRSSHRAECSVQWPLPQESHTRACSPQAKCPPPLSQRASPCDRQSAAPHTEHHSLHRSHAACPLRQTRTSCGSAPQPGQRSVHASSPERSRVAPSAAAWPRSLRSRQVTRCASTRHSTICSGCTVTRTS